MGNTKEIECVLEPLFTRITTYINKVKSSKVKMALWWPYLVPREIYNMKYHV